MLKRWAIGLGVALLAAQLARPERTNPADRFEISAPSEIAALLRRSCYDCHSYRTRWPWYSNLVPVSWYLVDHVREARGELNFTDWPILDLDAQKYQLLEMKKEIKAGTMPLRSYLLIHRKARLSDEERGRLIQWIDSEVSLLSQPLTPLG